MVDQQRSSAAVESRMHYFFALHSAAQGNRDKQIEHLRKGIESDPSDADVLIAMFRLAEPDQEWRKTTSQAIRSVAGLFHQQVAEAREVLNRLERTNDNSQKIAAYRQGLRRCNQFAWLIGNTEGDFQEALRCSQESLRLIPDYATFLDTLGAKSAPRRGGL